MAFELREDFDNSEEQEFMTEREKDGRASPRKDDEIIPGQHGKHGGSMESEGAPQKGTREASEPAKSTDEGRRNDGA